MATTISEPTNFELFNMLMMTPRSYVSLDYPRNDANGNPLFSFAMVVLNNQEEQLCQANAEKKARRLLKDNMPAVGEESYGYKALYDSCLVEEIVYFSCRNPNDVEKHIFPDTKAIAKSCSSDEIAVLFRNYLDVKLKFSPIIAAMDTEEMDAWIEKLAKGAEQGSFFLNQLSAEAMKILFTYMASRLYNSQMEKSFVGTQSNEPTINT